MVQINPVWAIYIIILIFACLNIWILVNRRIHTKVKNNQTQGFRKHCIRCNLTGSVLILIGIGFFAWIWWDVERSPSLMRPITKMTAEPFQLLAITLFIVGLTAVMTGISFHKIRSTPKNDM